MPPTPGTRIGSYEIISAIGAGGMGEVYRARDTRLDRTVAIKVLRPSLVGDPEFRERFEREARTLSRIEHPHICALYDVGTHEGTAYLVMQYLDGKTLADRLTRGPLNIADALKIAIQLCDALVTAHRHGVIHRDLKPGNVMLTGTGARLLDFGLAREAIVSRAADVTELSPPPAAGSVTAEGTILGTLHYMAPEQLKGQAVDERSDIFALGVVIYEMLAGRRPFDAGDSATVVAQILEHPAPPLVQLPAIPLRLERAIQTALEKNPQDRWQTCRDFLRELVWITQEWYTPAAPVVPGSAVRTGFTRRRSIAAAAILAGTLLLGVPFALNWKAPAGRSGNPVAVLMDSSHPQRVYDPATLRVGGTNADDLTDLLGDLPLSLVKETTGSSWHREDQILAQSPDFVLVHRSCFYDATLLDDIKLNEKYFQQLYAPAADKLEMLLGYLALGNPRTRFVVYSRGSWPTEDASRAWVGQMERRFPRITGRLIAYKVPLDRATFKHPQTAGEIKKLVAGLLEADRSGR